MGFLTVYPTQYCLVSLSVFDQKELSSWELFYMKMFFYGKQKLEVKVVYDYMENWKINLSCTMKIDIMGNYGKHLTWKYKVLSIFHEKINVIKQASNFPVILRLDN